MATNGNAQRAEQMPKISFNMDNCELSTYCSHQSDIMLPRVYASVCVSMCVCAGLIRLIRRQAEIKWAGQGALTGAKVQFIWPKQHSLSAIMCSLSLSLIRPKDTYTTNTHRTHTRTHTQLAHTLRCKYNYIDIQLSQDKHRLM